jgi:hypothetical protein
MDILDRDWFDKTPNTPEHTSWTMSVLNDLDKSLGPGVMDKPILSVNDPSMKSPQKSLDSPLAKRLLNGQFDYLFDSTQSLSEMFRESLQSPRSPVVKFVSSSHVTPISTKLPQYPPIARAAHVSGQVTALFDVTPQGRIENLTYKSGPEMLRGSVSTALAEWVFPESSAGHPEEATFDFNLNCADRLINASSSMRN